jgi:hypothetical protein
VLNIVGDSLRSLEVESLSEAKAVFSKVLDALYESEEVEKVFVSPTAWERYEESRPDSEIRVKVGCWFGIKQAAEGLIPMLVALIVNPPGLAISGPRGLVKLINSWKSLTGNDRLVFEAIHSLGKVPTVTNYDNLADPPMRPKAFGFQGPSSEELDRHLEGQLSPTNIRQSLIRLQSKNIIGEAQASWNITF